MIRMNRQCNPGDVRPARSIKGRWCYIHFLLVLFTCPSLLHSTSANADDHFFLPNNLPASSERTRTRAMNFGGLTNADLLIRAEQLRNDDMTATHRAMNHQWLSVHYNDQDVIQGGKALSRFLQKGAKLYWNHKRAEYFSDSKFVPDANGKGSVNDFDYDVKLSSDTLKLGLTYEF